MSLQRLAMLSLLALALSSAAAGAAVYHVTTDGNDANPGTSWAEAKQTIGAALLISDEGDEIWVAKGRYEERIQNRVVGDAAVNVALYGGFSGVESSLAERDVEANVTTIDGSGLGTVLTITSGARPTTRVDGFRITGGRGIDGGGIRIVTAAPIVANNTIYLNETNGLGAGIHVSAPNAFGEHPLITGNKIVENFALESVGEGGGIGLSGSSATIVDNVIARNRASQNGGGIAVHGDAGPVIEGNFIVANSANILPPGTGLDEDPIAACWVGGGGIFATSFSPACAPIPFAVSAPIVRGNVIAANGAYLGGGLALLSTDGTATLTNNTIAANSGAGVYWSEATVELSNNLVVFNSEGLRQIVVGTTAANLRNNNVFGNELQHRKTDYLGLDDETGSNGNISADPLLANILVGDLHLQPGSPCLDAGDTTAAAGLAEDVDGDARVIGSAIDIGADESDGTTWSGEVPVVYVRTDGGDAASGLSWETAMATVEAAIDLAAATGGEVWVAAGEGPTDVYQEHVEVPAFVQLYGGFAGTESDRSGRDWEANPTILDGGGEIGVVRFVNAGYGVARLDGFVVQNGGVYTGGTLPTAGAAGHGGGVEIGVSGPVVANNTIRHNSVGYCPTILPGLCPDSAGAGISAYMSSAIVTGNVIEENEVWDSFDGAGGGVYFELSHPTIEGNVIRNNRAKYGSAVRSKASTPLIVGNLIEGNSMYETWITPTYGAVWANFCFVHLELGKLCGQGVVIERNVIRGNVAYQGAGVCLWDLGKARVESNLFVDNVAYDFSGVGDGGFGGGLFVSLLLAPEGDVRVVNNTFIGNTATHSYRGELGGAVGVTGFSDAIVLANNVIASNSSGIWKDSIPGLGVRVLDCNDVWSNGGFDYVNLAPGANDMSLDPQFADADGRLGSSSPCLDGGSPNEGPSGTLDLDGTHRFKDADWDGAIRVDIGAYEHRTPWGIDVAPTTGLVTSETGDTAEFEVSLYGAPAAPVTIGLASSDPGEGSLVPTTLTFTAADWSLAQTVTVTGVDDTIEDSDQAFSVVTAPSSSADSTYANLNAADVAVLNLDDNDCGGFEEVLIDSRTFSGGETIVCTAIESLSTTGDVLIDDQAVVTFSAPEVALGDGFTIGSAGAFQAP